MTAITQTTTGTGTPGSVNHTLANSSVLELIGRAHDGVSVTRHHETASVHVATKDSYEADIAAMSAHLAALDTFIFPAARARLSHGRAAVTPLRRRVHRVEQLVRVLEGRLRGSSHTTSAATHDVHTRVMNEYAALEDDEWMLASRLDAELTTSRRTRLLTSLSSAARRSPTRPHPYIPHSRGLARLTFRVCAAWDRAMDTMDGRSLPRLHEARRPTPAGRWGMFLLGGSDFRQPTDEGR